MRVLSLFAGIGGMDLGLERAGMTVAGQCEIDPFCQRVLAKHWPGVWRWDDARTLTGEIVREHCGHVDLVCAGFPCQDISCANTAGTGVDGQRSSLWREPVRVLGELGCRFGVLENSPALTYRGLGTVLGGLADIGYDAEWSVVPACALGAPHSRERLFLLAYPQLAQRRPQRSRRRDVDDPLLRLHPDREEGAGWFRERTEEARGFWSTEPSVGRVASRVPRGMDRRAGLGNAVVPQVAEFIGRLIMENA